jgi:hypothetical protein
MDNARTTLENELIEMSHGLSEVNLRRLLLFGRGLLQNNSNKCKYLVSNKKLTNGPETLDKSGFDT